MPLKTIHEILLLRMFKIGEKHFYYIFYYIAIYIIQFKLIKITLNCENQDVLSTIKICIYIMQ